MHIFAAGNWKLTLPIYDGFVRWPTGPLELDDGETMVWVEAWVTQKTTGAVQMTYQAVFADDPKFAGDPKTWTADQVRYPEPWTGGKFTPGPALGTAIAISKTKEGQRYYWWIQEVELKDSGS